MGGSHHYNVADDDYRGDGIPLNDATRTLVAIVHYLTIPVVTFTIWALMKKLSVFEQRIFSPFILMVTLTWYLMAAAFEIANHYYIDNWQLYDPQADLINGSFSFFNFGAQNLLALSLRKKDLKFFRCGTSILDWLAIIWDPIFVLLIFANPIVYGLAGRQASVTALSPLASVGGLFALFRVWYNLGPNKATMLGGIFYFVLVMIGVIMLAVYNSTEAEFVHLFIGGSFISSMIPLTIAFLNAEVAEEKSSEKEDEKGDGDGEV